MEKKTIKPNPEFWENLGKLLMDMAKLTFASFILGGILKGELPQNVLIVTGCIVFIFFCNNRTDIDFKKKEQG